METDKTENNIESQNEGTDDNRVDNATNISTGKAIERVEKFLTKESPIEYNPSTLAKELFLNESTVRSCLVRLLRLNKIIQTKRGYYRGILEADKIPRWLHSDIQIHGLKIQAQFPKNFDVDTGHLLVAKHKSSSDEGRETYSTLFDDRPITITIHKSGLVEIFNRSSRQPLGFLEFNRFIAYLEGLFPFFSVMNPTLVQLGLNMDSKLLRLEGVKSIKLQTFSNSWYQVYQKAARGVRTELHIQPVNLTLPEALDLMKMIYEMGKEMEGEA